VNAKRKHIPKAVEAAVLIKSRRRCCLCYFWEGNLAQQDGQIAHVDRDPSNPAEDNLAWLCFRHHNQYDARQSQGKNVTRNELRHAREQLHAAVADLPPDAEEQESSALGAGLPTPPPARPSGLQLPLLYHEANLPKRNPHFVGRERLKDRVREFVSGRSSGGYLVLIGGMGRGKTAFLTELVHDQIDAGREPIRHFIDYHPSATGEGDTIVRSLLDQLRSKYPERS
jgi:hypothetical protein